MRMSSADRQKPAVPLRAMVAFLAAAIPEKAAFLAAALPAVPVLIVSTFLAAPAPSAEAGSWTPPLESGFCSASPAQATILLPRDRAPAKYSAGAQPVPDHAAPSVAQERERCADLGSWTLAWDAKRGLVHMGSGRLETTRAPTAFVPRFVDDHAALLGVNASQIAIEDMRTTGRLVHLHYRQQHAGLPVEGAMLRFTFSDDGDLVFFSSRALRDLDPPALEPSLPLDEARRVALAGVVPARRIAWMQGDLALLPRQISGLPEDRLVWRVRCRMREPAGAWRMLVDALSGELLERRSLVSSLHGERHGVTPGENRTGEARGLIRSPTPWGSRQEVGFPDLCITAFDGQEIVAEDFTDPSGAFDLGPIAAEELRLQASLEGRYACIHEGALLAPPDSIVLSDPPDNATFFWDSTVASASAREAYIHVNAAHAALESIDPEFPNWLDASHWPRFANPFAMDAPPLDQPIPVVVNDPAGSCNAYALCDPEAPELHFYVGGADCASTARIADVVYHEYGHLVTLYAYWPEWAPDYLHEAFSDYFAATIRDTSLIGLDLYGPGTSERNIEHDRSWPVGEECENDPYCMSLLLSGALWDIRAELIRQLPDRETAIRLADSLFHYSRYGKPLDFQSCLLEMIVLDDDDHDLRNGTPHLDAIAYGFERHGIGDFSVEIIHAPLADIEDTTAAPEVTASIWSIIPPDPQQVRLLYRVNGGPFTAEGMEDEQPLFTASLPPQAAGSTVHYYIVAADTRGHTATLPAGAPAETFSYRIGVDETPPIILHSAPGDPTVGQERLWLAARVTDNSGLVDSVLAAATVETGSGNWSSTWTLTRKSAPPPGNGSLTDLYEGCLTIGPLEEGDRVLYSLSATDISSPANRARFPSEGTVELRVRKGRYWDFESGALDLTLEGDWECGSVTRPDPPLESSGTHLVGTTLSGDHSVQLTSMLTTGPLDLSDWTQATVEFRTWYQTEDEYDGGRILASRDAGESWALVTPLGGYPGTINYDGDGDGNCKGAFPAFTGSSDGWQKISVPLDAFAGDTLHLRFVYVSDSLVTDLGWYLDDLKVIELHTLAPPADLAASEGEDGRVSLRWLPPGTATGRGQQLEGYRVYRAIIPGDYGPEALATLSTNDRRWTDTDVSNGNRYYYAVTSLFDAGDDPAESPLSNEVIGYPYRAAVDPVPPVEMTLYGKDAAGDTVYVANVGTGVLSLDFYHGDIDDEWSDLIVTCEVTGAVEGVVRQLCEDPADAPTPDLAYLACQKVNENLLFRVGLHDTLPDPKRDFTLFLYLDTDLSRSSGYQDVNIGAEYVVMIGAQAHERWGEPAYILDEELLPVARPSVLILDEGLDSLEVGVSLQTLGWPERLACALRVVLAQADSAAAEPPAGDRIPDAPRSTWLSSPTSGSAKPGAPYPLALAFDISGHSQDEFAARIFISSNDPEQPRIDFPVALHICDSDGISSLALDAPRPTPFRASAALRLHLPSKQAWSLEIVDITGRLVRRLGSSAGEQPGIQLLIWDGRRDDGGRVDQGVYYAIARCGRREVTRTLVLIR